MLEILEDSVNMRDSSALWKRNTIVTYLFRLEMFPYFQKSFINIAPVLWSIIWFVFSIQAFTTFLF